MVRLLRMSRGGGRDDEIRAWGGWSTERAERGRPCMRPRFDSKLDTAEGAAEKTLKNP